jgi:hypothetical protein
MTESDMITFSKRGIKTIKQEIILSSRKQAAEDFGIAEGTLRKLLRQEEVSKRTLKKVVAYFGNFSPSHFVKDR